ncbi:PepSY domain-containing protein [Marinospirillum sp.]|uniref:PepSY domain-containing protein n=1 Tax=Marinospirillum sp. TaxID=2183934 RepID=UPI0028707EFD|nr:PepSY domain-containing protein [Marinospirillum sp.]MDR9467999.1 PepSY domain-containing protein [Marinospirillum sp.]
MKNKFLVLSLSLLLLSGAALADDDCDDPVANWQPRENLREKLEAEGWTVRRIKVDDGCYEVKGRDSNGVKAEAEFAPASLKMMKWEREEDDDKDERDYRDKTRMPDNGIVKGRPSVTVE